MKHICLNLYDKEYTLKRPQPVVYTRASLHSLTRKVRLFIINIAKRSLGGGEKGEWTMRYALKGGKEP